MGGGGGGGGGDTSSSTVVPWYKNPRNIGIGVLALLIVAGAAYSAKHHKGKK